MGMLATVGTYPVIPFVLAGIVFAVFFMLFRARTTYRQLLAIASHALLIPAAGTVLRVIGRGAGISFIKSDPAWSLTQRAVLSIDPYIVWMLIVIVVAASALDQQLPRIRAGMVLVGGYLALVFSSTAILHHQRDPNAITASAASTLVASNKQASTGNWQLATGN